MEPTQLSSQLSSQLSMTHTAFAQGSGGCCGSANPNAHGGWQGRGNGSLSLLGQGGPISFGMSGSLSGTANAMINALNPTAASTRMEGGKVHFANDHYDINVSDHGEINVHNKHTGEHYRIWGDPHVDVDGQRAFDFKGDTSFILDDGTKITIQTTPWRGNNGQTISSEVSIIDGQSNYGVHIKGVDDYHSGDLTFEETRNLGQFLDSMIDDGNYVHENPEGSGFIAVGQDGWAEVDQSVMNFIEGAPERLGMNDWLSALDGFLPDSPLAAFLLGASLQSTLSDLTGWLEQFRSHDSGSTAEPLLQRLDSLLSLVQQQSRPFGYFSGLNEIHTQGAYELGAGFNPFHFNLRYARY
ncbi:MAG: DUF1521 domain-containing protein [Oleiphilaceae bacterium]|nr:DUF1521 domain-containing protein [Oleiphilaceae bacterium]